MTLGPTITGRLVRLRAPRGDDAAPMTALLQDPRVVEHLDHWSDPPYTIEKSRWWIQGTADTSTSVAWAIECLADGAYIGNTGLDSIDTVDRHCSWGIWIAPPERWGHGYGTEACILSVQHAFRRLALSKVSLHVYAGNDRGRRAYEKAGFVSEGVLRRHHWNGRVLVDVEVMAVFADNPLYGRFHDVRQ